MANKVNAGNKTKNVTNGLVEDHGVENLGDAFQRNIRPYIEVIDTLRKHGLQRDIKLPNVVVVGDQSSGKSSIIEAISGVQLPRGKGIVTRCPLELQLKRMVGNVKWKGTLSHNGKNVSIEKPEDVEALIIRAQNEICGTSKNISEGILTLRIESNAKNAPELTLIDLPGIARLSMIGQDLNIKDKIKTIINGYVKNENTVILCMISANLDVAVNEALEIASIVDPRKERTIGVITKPDLAEDHQKIISLQLLNNEIFKLKKGYRMVKCRSDDELMKKITLPQSIENEEQFFKNDKIFREANPSLLGTINLANKITEELVSIIKKTIPQLKEEIQKQLEFTKTEISKLPTGVPTDDVDKRVYLNTIVNELLKLIEKLLTRGSSSDENAYTDWRKLHETFQIKLKDIQTKSFSSEFSNRKLQDEIIGFRGREICGFLNYELFESLISKHVQLYRPVAMALLKKLSTSTEESLLNVIDGSLNHVSDVRKDIRTVVTDELEKCVSEAEQNINLIFDEENVPFAMDSVFQEEMRRMTDTKNSDILNLENNADMLGKILRCYLKIVLNRLCDIIPMTIRQWINIKLFIILEATLIRYISESSSEEKVKEDEESRIKRYRLMDKLKRLELAKRSLNQY